jgi:rfaE bifunctional protein kinase chain/domain
MNLQRLAELLHSFTSKRILVIGDLILDEFVWGKVRRISPEAPVPVVEVDRETYYPGGAANVARNLREFGCNVDVIGILGTEVHGVLMKSLLVKEGISTDSLVQDTNYPTIVKTRIIAKQQQVVRVDRERKISLTSEQQAPVLAGFEGLLPQLDAVILEDYGKGLFTQNFTDAILEITSARDVLVTVDPNPSNPLRWHSLSAAKPNRLEAFAAAGFPWSEPIDPVVEDTPLIEVGDALLEKWDCENLLITLSEQGMMLFRRDQPPFHTPTKAREVFDVSGAGDTSIALFTLALSAGASPIEAAQIANHAGGVVVGKLGTATLTPAELSESFEENGN